MTGRALDGRAAAERVEQRVREAVHARAQDHDAPLRLDAILVGEDSASQLYVQRKHDACRRVGIDARLHQLPGTASTDDVARLIFALNEDPDVTGILLQLPLPAGCDKHALVERIDPRKDVDCFHPANLGRAMQGIGRLLPATPKGILQLLEDASVDVAGQDVCIVNHGNLIGRPLAALLLQRDATVTVCHKRTRDLARHTRQADILVTATGVPGLITADHVREGAVVLDAGIAREGRKLRGDVRYEEVLAKARLVTPVPGGVGPMTVASLLDNLLVAHELQQGAPRRTAA